MNDKRQLRRPRTHDRSRHPRVKFPDLTGTGCDTTSSPSGKACYSMGDDVTGLTATKLVFTKPGQASTSGNGYSPSTSQTSPSPSMTNYVG